MHFFDRSGAGFGAPERANSPIPWLCRILFWFAAVVGVSQPLAAQADRVDAGSFSVFERGVRLGREQFSVRRAPSPDGTAFELRAESIFGERRIAVQQSIDSLGSPVHYSLEVREGTAVSVRAGGQRVRGRFVTQARRPSGESAREYMLAPGVIILEPGFYHQLAVALRGRQPVVGQLVEMTVLSVLENSQQRLNLVLEARDDAVVIGGTRLAALRWRLEAGAQAARTIWADSEGRLLKVLIAAQFLEATRDDLPK
jgi:hypothetical protein